MAGESEDIDISSLCHGLVPIAQDDGPHTVCAIKYSPSYSEAMDYLRAIMHNDERSDRALRLTAICLNHNPANYTIWHFRRSILSTLSSHSNMYAGVNKKHIHYDHTLVERELEFTSKLGGINPKNYQIWYHRRSLLECICISEPESIFIQNELSYMATVLDEDGKNYHAWSNRQWLIATINKKSLWEDEKLFVHEKIANDHRNNSAWNHRWFVCCYNTNTTFLDLDIAKVEAEYAIKTAAIDIYNESPWSYLIGVLKKANSLTLISQYEKEISNIKHSQNGGNESNSCAELLSAQIDLLEMKNTIDAYNHAANISHDLAHFYDTIRNKYWLEREKELRSQINCI